MIVHPSSTSHGCARSCSCSPSYPRFLSLPLLCTNKRCFLSLEFTFSLSLSLFRSLCPSVSIQGGDATPRQSRVNARWQGQRRSCDSSSSARHCLTSEVHSRVQRYLVCVFFSSKFDYCSAPLPSVRMSCSFRCTCCRNGGLRKSRFILSSFRHSKNVTFK